jgi:hypothetical protein
VQTLCIFIFEASILSEKKKKKKTIRKKKEKTTTTTHRKLFEIEFNLRQDDVSILFSLLRSKSH